jgi:response regulator of citrate/malate metabolism
MNGKTVIIIEDSEIIADLIKKFITDKFGYIVKWFDSAEAYFKQIVKGDLVFLDFYLDSKNRNAMNGLDFLKKLDEYDLQIPVVTISGITDKKIIEELKRHKIVNFIDKDAPEFWTRLENEVRTNL